MAKQLSKDPGSEAQAFEKQALAENHLNLQVQELRQRIRNNIIRQCDRMRTLDMPHPVRLSDIYVDMHVNLQVASSQRININELNQQISTSSRPTAATAKVKKVEEQQDQNSLTAIEAIEKYHKLAIVGAMGAGKTMLLRYIALLSSSGEIHADKVPLLINLYAYSQEPFQPNLSEYVVWQLKEHYVQNEEQPLQLLHQGKFLLLIDGYAQINSRDRDRILWQLGNLSDRFHLNRIVITAREPIPAQVLEDFTTVEIARFEPAQIKQFVYQWTTNLGGTSWHAEPAWSNGAIEHNSEI
jgi:predicted NACHT family NTPase